MSKMIQLPKLLRDAEVRAASFDEANNTIEVIWTTGATVRRMSWMDGEFDEELVVGRKNVRMDRLNSGAPFLDTHSRYGLGDVIGTVVRGSAKIVDGKGIARVLLSGAADAADRVAKIKEGVVSNISVGYRIWGVEKKERANQIPLHRVIDWEPWEISAVPVPADYGAQVRSGDGTETYACRVDADMSDFNEVARIRMRMAERQMELVR